MSILLRNGNSGWVKATKITFDDEVALQKLLYESPELIVDGDARAVFVKEAGLTGSGFTDLLGVDSEGNILVIETKLAKNQEIRRKVIGQILEYGAYLWRMSFRDFDELFQSREGRGVTELLNEKCPGLDSMGLRDKIDTNLRDGNFELIVAVDEINDELQKIITFAATVGGIRLQALEVGAYKNGPTEVLAPKRFGKLEQSSFRNSNGNSGGIRNWQEVIADCPDEHCREMLTLTSDLWEKAGNEVRPQKRGAGMWALVNGKRESIFWVFPDHLQILFSRPEKQGVPASVLKTYRDAIASIPGFDRNRILAGAMPMVYLDEVKADGIRQFVEVTLRFVEKRNEVARAAGAN